MHLHVYYDIFMIWYNENDIIMKTRGHTFMSILSKKTFQPIVSSTKAK